MKEIVEDGVQYLRAPDPLQGKQGWEFSRLACKSNKNLHHHSIRAQLNIHDETYRIINLSLVEHGYTNPHCNTHNPHGDRDELKHRANALQPSIARAPHLGDETEEGNGGITVSWSRSRARMRGYETGRWRIAGGLGGKVSRGWEDGETKKEGQRVATTGRAKAIASEVGDRLPSAAAVALFWIRVRSSPATR